MISVEEAKQIVLSKAERLATTSLSLSEAKGHYLASDLVSHINMPPFRQSAMDGYAVHFNEGDQDFDCVAELQAGHGHNIQLKPGQAARIFTGAAVPDSANAVIMQEWIESDETSFPYRIKLIQDKTILQQHNIRPLGEQFKVGDTALKEGDYMNASALGLAQMLGLSSISVIKKPRFSIVITGNELAKAGEPLSYGQIYESNSISLASGIEMAGFQIAQIFQVKDDLEDTVEVLREAISKSDIVVVSGGISVGDHDYVGSALEVLHCESHIYKVKQKPGKPLYFGTLNSTSVFGLPGNPAASMTCLYEYVIPHAKKRAGANNCGPLAAKLTLSKSYTKRGDRAQFLKARIRADQVEILGDQASSMLTSMAYANCLVYISADKESIAEGELVEVHFI